MRGAGELSAPMARAIVECEPFGTYWAPGPMAASHWVIAPNGDYVVVKSATATRAARIHGDWHSHDGGRLCGCLSYRSYGRAA